MGLNLLRAGVAIPLAVAFHVHSTQPTASIRPGTTIVGRVELAKRDIGKGVGLSPRCIGFQGGGTISLSWSLTEKDRLQAEALGISEAQIRSQILTFQRSSFFVRLARPCTVGDGIRSVAPEKLQDYVQVQQRAARQGRFLKFVPASGAATRMFQIPSQFCYRQPHPSLQEIRQRAAENDADAASFIRFLEELPRFAFFDDLKSAMQLQGLNLEALLEQGRYPVILEYLLTGCGLGYEALPKGLLKFHR